MGRTPKTWIKPDAELVKQILKERNWSQNLMAEKMCMPNTTFTDRLNDTGFEPMEYRFLCMILGKSEDELKEKPAETTSKVEDILSQNAILESIKELKMQQKELSDSIIAIAKVIASIQKVSAENKAATELLTDDVKAIWNKSTEINATVSKMSAYIGAKYRAK